MSFDKAIHYKEENDDWFDKMCQKHQAKNHWKKEKPKKEKPKNDNEKKPPKNKRAK